MGTFEKANLGKLNDQNSILIKQSLIALPPREQLRLSCETDSE